ncbi:hypothetical protein [Pseudobacter ginsenosidimutans]|uniref:hypothetical protein n=1 Tax=Pseudobacter ginsenosidimutans TaxID=661488 RepID=UPI001CEF6261|nr:hypothetical protein [Pseudobacter ginsenosidimutans]
MAKVSFNNRNQVFYTSLKSDVDKYFEHSQQRKTGNFKLYFKSTVFILAAIGLYTTLLLAPLGIVPIILISLLQGFVLACIGFNVMHDANHGSYSSRKWVNETLGLTLNALGAIVSSGNKSTISFTTLIPI